jgi:hypothetical protein
LFLLRLAVLLCAKASFSFWWARSVILHPNFYTLQ